MHERIKELAKEATSYADTLDVADQKIYQEIRDREFAELIVRECVSLFDGTKEMKTVGMLSSAQVIEQIKEHFGVEE